ncbi:MAG: succinate dehydrogenase [Thiotrichales bacterium]|nr:succinate dehydrogenase [Thiotrichales bacterium]
MSFKPHRQHRLWWAFALHRLSGVLLALFLPFHFLVLGLAIEDSAKLDSFLQWSEQTWVKTTEFGLVFLLAAHLLGGLRLLALEFLPWSDNQKTYVSIGVCFAFVVAMSFAFMAV